MSTSEFSRCCSTVLSLERARLVSPILPVFMLKQADHLLTRSLQAYSDTTGVLIFSALFCVTHN